MPGDWSDGRGQDDAAPSHQRIGAPLHRRACLGRGSGGGTLDPGVPSPGAGRCRRPGGPGPSSQLRHRYGRGRAGLHHGKPRDRAERHAPARRRHARLARFARPAGATAHRPVRGSATAGGHRGGAVCLPAGTGPGRADLGARPGCRRGGPCLPDPTRPRPRHHRRAGRAPVGTGHPLCRPSGPGAGRRRSVGGGADCGGDEGGARGAPDRRARPGGRLEPAPVVGPRCTSLGRPPDPPTENRPTPAYPGGRWSPRGRGRAPGGHVRRGGGIAGGELVPCRR